MTAEHLASLVMTRLETLGQISEETGCLTRPYGSPAMGRANDLTATWMREAGMTVRSDAAGNLIGRYESSAAGAKTLLLGSHLDTVRDAGKYDGALGVVAGIACVQQLHDQARRLPFALEVVAFADEEGLRFQTTYLGSRVLAGTFDEADLKRVDEHGVSVAEAMRAFGGNPEALGAARCDPAKLLGYLELHIEQGPVLEELGQAVGVVTAVAGQSRLRVTFAGRAGHAGTTPMTARSDALCAAAEFILAAEQCARKEPGLVATVGQIHVQPGASNVIPSHAQLSLDVRHAEDARRVAACKELEAAARSAGAKRSVAVTWEVLQQTGAVNCSAHLRALLLEAARRQQPAVAELTSGAGHDAAVLAAITPVAMLFVRCRAGLSHHPDESVEVADVRVALATALDFLELLAARA